MLEYYIVSELNDKLRATKQDLVNELSLKYGVREIESTLAQLLETQTISSWMTNGTVYYTA